MINFCTLFNSDYLSRGLMLHDSLIRHCSSFHLYVFAFDNNTLDFLNAQKFPNLTVISLEEFEDEELLNLKNARSVAEYCWTCTPSIILYALQKYSLPQCTYIDADLYFYSDPAVLIDEMADKSILITEHRYTPEVDQTPNCGKYCVQFVSFKNDEFGLQALIWWRSSCIAWCFARAEDGKFGDQKYLDDWPQRFKGVHELQHLGGGVAPWNIQQYSFSLIDGKLRGTQISTGKKFEIIFFHFHGLRFYENDIVSLTGSKYIISRAVRDLFYKPYIQGLNKKGHFINSINNSFNPHGSSGKVSGGPINLLLLLKFYWYGLKSSPWNILGNGIRKRLERHHIYKMKMFKSIIPTILTTI